MVAGVAEAELAFDRVVFEHKLLANSAEVSNTIRSALKVRAPLRSVHMPLSPSPWGSGVARHDSAVGLCP
jgi:hypothetical protein